MTTTDAAPVDNGVDVAALLGAREAMTGMPAAAKFTWKAENCWLRGTHSRTSIRASTVSGPTSRTTRRSPWTPITPRSSPPPTRA